MNHQPGEVRANDNVTCTCHISVEGRDVEALIDTGSSVTLVRESVLNQAKIRETRPPTARLTSATGHTIPVIHEAKLEYNVGGQLVEHWTYVSPNLIHEALIGCDFVIKNEVIIDGARQTICCKNAAKLPLQGTRRTMEICVAPHAAAASSASHDGPTPGQESTAAIASAKPPDLRQQEDNSAASSASMAEYPPAPPGELERVREKLAAVEAKLASSTRLSSPSDRSTHWLDMA